MTARTMKNFRFLALALIALGVVLISLGPARQPASLQGMLPDGAESTRVAAILDQRKGGSNTQTAVVLLQTGTAPIDMRAVGRLAQQLGGPAIPNHSNDAAIIPVTVTANTASENAEKVAEIRKQAAAVSPDISSQVTGPAAIKADLAGVFAGANFLLLAVTGGIVALLLIATYRSPFLWLVPLVVIGVADRVAATVYTWVLDGLGMVWNESTSGILSVLVFGAGTNYALLLISRYRDELTRHEDRFAAMAAAWVPTVRTVAVSGGTVMVGVACLLISAVPTTRGLGVAAMVGIVTAFIFAMLALPGVLVACGRWIFWPKVPRLGHTPRQTVWDRVGRVVSSRPKAVVAATLVLLAFASVGVGFIRTGLDQSSQFVNTPESISAAKDLEQAFPGEDATPPTVVTQHPEAVNAALKAAGYTTRPAPPAAQWSVLSVPGAQVGSLRTALAHTDGLVGGSNAQLADTESSAARDRLIIFPLILLLILAVLVVMLRALVAPLVMTVSVLLTNLAALGLGWWLSGFLGFERFDSSTPLYAFVFLVALGIDYSIFLVERTREEAYQCGTRQGMTRALSATGGVITSAGILLASVFAALGVLPLVVLAQIGIIIFIGVLLDTLVVRTVLLPALVELLGERFWWPSKSLASKQLETAQP